MRSLVTLIIILSMVLSIYGQGSCVIEGHVSDPVSGESLPGVNVMIKGSYYGSATDLDGRFRLTGMSPGTYDIEFSMIGYKVVLKTNNIVSTAEPIFVEIELEQTTLALGQEVVVEGDRPLFEVDQTSSSVRLTSDDLKMNIVENVGDVLAEQAGITSQDNEIHIRGGRVDESMFIVDGMSVKDPLSGSANNLYLNVDAIEELEVITGGFNAEYGQAMSGIINIRIKEGSEDYHGTFSYSSDHFGLKALPWDAFTKDRVEFTLSGPDIFSGTLNALGLKVPGQFSFFLNGYMNLNDSYLPGADDLFPSQSWMESLAPRNKNNWHGLYKLTWRINDQQKLSVSYDYSLDINQGWGFPYRYQYILNNNNTITKESILSSLLYTHTLSSKLFFEIAMGRFFTNIHSAVQNKHWTEYQQTSDIEPINYSLQQPEIEGVINVSYGDEFWDHGDASGWYDYYSDNLSIATDVNYQPSKRHSFKAGYDHKRSELQVIDINSPWLGESGLGRNYDFWNATTDYGAFYIQDRITFDGMIANLGIRYDYWFPGQYLEDAVADSSVAIITDAARAKFYAETFELGGHRGKGHLSPRLGISHPVTDSDVLYFNYGHFSQLPTFNYVYAKLRSSAEATYQLFGNPNLSPKTTVAYEIGVKHKFDANQVLEIKAFYKDMFGYETSQKINSFHPKEGRISYLIYINMDYARSRGVEVNFKRRFARYFSADANASYSFTTGKSSTPLDNLLVESGRLDEKPLGENYLRWDQPFSIFTNLHFNVGKKDQPHLFGLRLPKDWGISARIEYQAGRRFTGVKDITTIEVDGKLYYLGTPMSDTPYSETADPFTTVDLKLNKYFQVIGLEWKAYCTIENLFNVKQPTSVNPFTGKGYDPGEIFSYSFYRRVDPNYNPGRYSIPRTVEMGMSLRF